MFNLTFLKLFRSCDPVIQRGTAQKKIDFFFVLNSITVSQLKLYVKILGSKIF